MISDIDASLQWSGEDPNPNEKYTYGIRNLNGDLIRMGEVKLNEPLGVVDLPEGEYMIHVWDENSYQKFYVLRLGR